MGYLYRIDKELKTRKIDEKNRNHFNFSSYYYRGNFITYLSAVPILLLLMQKKEWVENIRNGELIKEKEIHFEPRLNLLTFFAVDSLKNERKVYYYDSKPQILNALKKLP